MPNIANIIHRIGSSTMTLLLTIMLFASVVGGAILNPQWEEDVTQKELDDMIAKNQLIDPRLKRCNTVPGWDQENVYKLTNASVVVLDEELLCADFAHTCNMARNEKDAWILDQAAWFSVPHIQARRNNIPHDSSQQESARRACIAGRALLLPVHDDSGESNAAQGAQQWLDVKGLGSTNPREHSRVESNQDSCNGLIDLHDVLWEYLNEKTMTSALEHHKQRYPERTDEHYDVVGHYAVLSLGFEFRFETDVRGKYVYYPAAGLVRQAARRHPNGFGFMDIKEAIILEQLMNAYGMRSDTHNHDKLFPFQPNACRRINIQGTYRSQTVTDLSNVYGVGEGDWPVSGDECLVHWANVFTKLETPTLWNHYDFGSATVRKFLSEELKHLPPSDDVALRTTRMADDARGRRMWHTAVDFWHGKIGVPEVEEAIRVGLIDEALAKSDGSIIDHSEL